MGNGAEARTEDSEMPLNTTHFTHLAGETHFDAEMRERLEKGADLIELQFEFHGRGRAEAEVVKTIYGYSIRYVSGLHNFAIIHRRIPSYEDAVRIGTEWVEKAPQMRSLIVLNSAIPKSEEA
jgi:hypothetical protein